MSPSRIRVPDLKDKKSRGEKIAMLTAYDATMARLLDQAGVDALLVGDSVGMVVLGYENTVAVTLDDMLHHTRAVVRGASRALVVTDMPFLSYQVSVDEAVRNAGRLLQEGGASAVKLEGGRPVLDAVRRMVDVGIPVMGHLGLQPQSVHQVGGYIKQATRPQDADALRCRCDRAAGCRGLRCRARVDSRGGRQDGERGPGHSDNRDWRRSTLRRAGARQPRHAGALRSLRSVLREAVRRTWRRRYRRRPELTWTMCAKGATRSRCRRFPACPTGRTGWHWNWSRRLPTCGRGSQRDARQVRWASFQQWVRCTRGTPA